MTVVTVCPECAERLRLGSRLRIGERKTCANCGVNLEVAGVSPLILDIYNIQRPRSKTPAKRRHVAEALCPECDSSLKLGTHPRRGQPITCPECEALLEVVSLSPLELDTPITTRKKRI